MEVRQAQKAAVLYQVFLPMVLEEEMGRVTIARPADTHSGRQEGSAIFPVRTAGNGSGSAGGPCRAIGEVSNYLTTAYPKFKVAFSSPAFYYDNIKPMFTLKNDELTVYVRIPVVSGEHLFRVYEVLSFPVPINMAQKDALQIVNLPAHVAVSLTRQYYKPLVNYYWPGCYRQTIVMCKDLPYMRKVTDITCIASLLPRDRSEIVKLCLLDYLLNPDFAEMAIYLEGGEVLVVSAEKEGQPIMIAADPIPTDMRTHIQLAAQGFAARVPLTDLMHTIRGHKEEKRQTIKKINQE